MFKIYILHTYIHTVTEYDRYTTVLHFCCTIPTSYLIDMQQIPRLSNAIYRTYLSILFRDEDFVFIFIFVEQMYVDDPFKDVIALHTTYNKISFQTWPIDISNPGVNQEREQTRHRRLTSLCRQTNAPAWCVPAPLLKKLLLPVCTFNPHPFLESPLSNLVHLLCKD